MYWIPGTPASRHRATGGTGSVEFFPVPPVLVVGVLTILGVCTEMLLVPLDGNDGL